MNQKEQEVGKMAKLSLESQYWDTEEVQNLGATNALEVITLMTSRWFMLVGLFHPAETLGRAEQWADPNPGCAKDIPYPIERSSSAHPAPGTCWPYVGNYLH